MTTPARKDFTGGSVVARLDSDITNSSTTVVLAATPGVSGWPVGANGEFGVVFDRGNAGEEKALALSRSGTTLTFASAAKRGKDGTSAASHAAGVTVEHCFFASDADEANSHVSDVTTDLHPIYTRKAQNLADLAAVATARTNLGFGSVVKSADESVSSASTGTTLQDDNELLLPLLAATDYLFEAFLYIVSASTPDFKFAMTLPTGASPFVMQGYYDDQTAMTIKPTGVQLFGGSPLTVPVVTGTVVLCRVAGSVTTGVNAGNLQLQWAQDTSNATATTVKAGSWLRVQAAT